MARHKHPLRPSRIVLRLSDRDTEILQCYTTDELSQIFSKALNTITPDFDVGVNVPSVLRPKNIATCTIARVSIKGTVIQVLFPEKLEDFRNLAHKLLYSWEAPFWKRDFQNEKVICDRAAELAYRTLELGIPVQIDYTGVRDKVISGKFLVEPTRIIKVISSGIYQGWFKLFWRREDDLYNKAISLTAAKYVDKAVIIPPEQFLELEDFAETENFEFSESAKSALEDAKKMREIERLIDVRPLAKRHIKKSKKATVEVPEHLKDE